MSNPTLYSSRSHDKSLSMTILQKVRQFTIGIRSRQTSSASYLDTDYLDDHVLKDIGLERSDLTRIE